MRKKHFNGMKRLHFRLIQTHKLILLIYLYSRGLGVGKDLNESFAWYSIAAQGGHRLAVENVALLALKLSPSDVDTAKPRAASLLNHAGRLDPGRDGYTCDTGSPDTTLRDISSR